MPHPFPEAPGAGRTFAGRSVSPSAGFPRTLSTSLFGTQLRSSESEIRRTPRRTPSGGTTISLSDTIKAGPAPRASAASCVEDGL